MKPSHYKSKSVVDDYDKKRFATKKWTKEYLDVIERGFVAKYAKGKVLDVACGTGRLAFLDNYTGIDFSKEMIHKANKSYPQKEFWIGDATDLPFNEESFDTVIALRLLMHMGKNWKKTFDEMHRVCKKGGIIIIDTKTKLLTIQNALRKEKIIFVPLKELPRPSVVFEFPPAFPLTRLLVIKK